MSVRVQVQGVDHAQLLQGAKRVVIQRSSVVLVNNIPHRVQGQANRELYKCPGSSLGVGAYDRYPQYAPETHRQVVRHVERPKALKGRALCEETRLGKGQTAF